MEVLPGQMLTMLTWRKTFIFHCVKTETLLVFFLKQNHLIRSQEEVQGEVHEVPHLSAQEQIQRLWGSWTRLPSGSIRVPF